MATHGSACGLVDYLSRKAFAMFIKCATIAVVFMIVVIGLTATLVQHVDFCMAERVEEAGIGPLGISLADD